MGPWGEQNTWFIHSLLVGIGHEGRGCPCSAARTSRLGGEWGLNPGPNGVSHPVPPSRGSAPGGRWDVDDHHPTTTLHLGKLRNGEGFGLDHTARARSRAPLAARRCGGGTAHLCLREPERAPRLSWTLELTLLTASIFAALLDHSVLNERDQLI